MTIPRPEYPRPLLQRLNWLNLNGEWRFDTDPKNTGLVQKWYQHHDYQATIQVPFTMNASASGASHLTPCDVVWYAREFELPTHWHESQLLLHLGACDHRTQVYVNGELADTESLTGTIYTTWQPLYLGCEGSACTLPYYGIMDELEIYSTALTSEEVGEDYSTSLPAQVLPLRTMDAPV